MVTLFDQERLTEIHEYNLVKDARQEGHSVGRHEGRAEGRAEGHIEGTAASIKNLMDSMGWSMEQVMSALKISEEDRPKYRKLLNS